MLKDNTFYKKIFKNSKSKTEALFVGIFAKYFDLFNQISFLLGIGLNDILSFRRSIDPKPQQVHHLHSVKNEC